MNALVALLLSVSGPVHAVSHWDDKHRLIVTERTWSEGGVEHRDTVLGGSVDGIGMVQLPLLPGPALSALGWVPTVNGQRVRLHWGKSCVFIRPGTQAAQVPGDDRAVLQAALDAWRGATVGCGYLTAQLEAREAGEVGFDFVNRVIYREQRWCIPAGGGLPEKCHDASSIGLTTLFYRDLAGAPDDGTLFDADVELNGVSYALGVCGADGGCATTGSGSRADLQNTFTHELGHVFGLDHTCLKDPGSAVDATGQPVPLCLPEAALPAAVRDAVMYPISQPAEISKRSLSADDVDGFCALYPLAADPHDCSPVTALPDAGAPDAGPSVTDGGPTTMRPPSGCGCAADPSPFGVAVALLVTAWAARRRRSRGSGA